MTPYELRHEDPVLELRCDACLAATFLYRLHGTKDVLCGGCFVLAHASTASTVSERRRRAGGPPAAGCLRNLRSVGERGVHRRLGTRRR